MKQLLLYPLAGCVAPQWALLDNHWGVRCVVLITVDGLCEATVRENEAQFVSTAAVFGSAIPVNVFFESKIRNRSRTRCPRRCRFCAFTVAALRPCAGCQSSRRRAALERSARAASHWRATY